MIWKAKVWPKVKVFMWKFASNALVVRSNLERMGAPTSPVCLTCVEVETREHVLMGCRWTSEVWEGVLGIQMNVVHNDSLTPWMLGGNIPSFVRGTETNRTWELCMYTCWFIWKGMCKMAFENKSPNLILMISDIQRASWRRRCKLGRQPDLCSNRAAQCGRGQRSGSSK